MSRADAEAALMRLEIRRAKESDTFINRAVVFVTWDEASESESLIHLPYMKYFLFLSKQ